MLGEKNVSHYGSVIHFTLWMNGFVILDSQVCGIIIQYYLFTLKRKKRLICKEIDWKYNKDKKVLMVWIPIVTTFWYKKKYGPEFLGKSRTKVSGKFSSMYYVNRWTIWRWEIMEGTTVERNWSEKRNSGSPRNVKRRAKKLSPIVDLTESKWTDK